MHTISYKEMLFLAESPSVGSSRDSASALPGTTFQGQDVSQQGVNQGFPPFTESYHVELISTNTLGIALPSAELKKQLLGLLTAASSSSDLDPLQIKKSSKVSPPSTTLNRTPWLALLQMTHKRLASSHPTSSLQQSLPSFQKPTPSAPLKNPIMPAASWIVCESSQQLEI